MTDPHPGSPASGDQPVPETLTGRIEELAGRTLVPRTILERMGPESLDLMETSVAMAEASHLAWDELAGTVAGKLTAAGFRQNEPFGQRGGFHLNLSPDGVVVSWTLTEYTENMDSPFETTAEHAALHALLTILLAAGFAASIIPGGQDNAGTIRVTGRTGPGITTPAAEQ